MENNFFDYIVLEQLNKYAITLSGTDNKILSAENFLLAVVNMLTNQPVPETIAKIPQHIKRELSAICECYKISIWDTKEYLTPIIQEIRDPVFDEYNMDIMLKKADVICKGYKCTYLSPAFLLEAILQLPTETIKECKLSEKKYVIENHLALEIYNELMEKAKTACDTDDGCVTAEKYLWAVCNAVNNLSEDDLDTPIKDVTCAILEKSEMVFEDHSISPKILQPLLAEYILNVNDPTEGKARLMFYQEDVSAELSKKQLKYYSPEVLLDIILNEFPDVHKDIFEKHNALYKLQGLYNKTNPFEFGDDEYDCFVDYQSDVVCLDDVDAEKSKENPQDSFKMLLSCNVGTSKVLRDRLSGVIFGQDNAINTVASGFYHAHIREMTGKNKRKPYATFLFAGPPGVGKTFLSEALAKELNLPFRRFDMSEYSHHEANIEFCGSDKVYKGAKKGNFTTFIEENPQCVVLFDEIEKAHSVITNLFLQMLDAGIIRDNYTDKTLSLENVWMIFTTNAGKQLYENSESSDLSGLSRKVIIQALKDDINPTTKAPYFPAAICSRFASGNVVMFNHVTPHNLIDIAKKEITDSAFVFKKESGIDVGIDERLYTAILLAEGGNADARTIKNRAGTIFYNELYEFFRLSLNQAFDLDILKLEKIKIKVDLSDSKPEIAELFEQQSKPKTLVFSAKPMVNGLNKKASMGEFLCARTITEANEIMRKNDISVIFVDLNHGLSKADENYLNIGDETSVARDFLQQLRQEDSSIPIYLLETKKHTFTQEERISFAGQGIRGVISVVNNPDLEDEMKEIFTSIHEQQSVIRLAKENKVVSYETAQRLSDDEKTAEIILFDFKLKTAVDSDDSQSILNNISKPDVRFSQVIGAEDAKQELAYFVEYLKNPKKYIGTGVKPPKGVLLYGPSGTGKTMLAKAMAGESDVTFLCAEGNQFLKGTVGEGSKAIHDLFRTARKYAPSILFIDEIDAIAKERIGSGSSEETLTALLTEMDGFQNQTAKPVFVLAATNFTVEEGTKKSLDPALMRRFDRRIYVDLPDRDDRIKFMTMKIKSNPAFDISEEMIKNLAVRSTGMSLAALDSVFEFSLRMVIRNKKTVVTDSVLDEAFEIFNNGEKRKWNEESLLRTARHEAGHAVICSANGEIPSYITIVPRGDHGGYMQHSTDENKLIFTKDELLARIRTSLGGRAAEIVYYGTENGVSTGAAGDLINATTLARKMVELYGMDDTLGLVACIDQEEMTPEIRSAVNKILVTEMNNAIEVIRSNKETIDKLSDALVNKNHLTSNEINNLLKK